jgi:2-isopropylmalate synthase
VQDVLALAQEIARARLSITANCAARTVRADIEPIARISQQTGIPIEACTFIGSSPIRQYAEDWTLDRMLRATEDAIRFAVSEGLPVMYVTEDTTRAQPDVLKQLYTTAIECGARRLCIADTVGHATPQSNGDIPHYLCHIQSNVTKIMWNVPLTLTGDGVGGDEAVVPGQH